VTERTRSDERATSEHPCPLPSARRKWRNSLYVCDCGRAWRAVRWENWAGGGWEWKEWPEA
jgi:hypothetical protein